MAKLLSHHDPYHVHAICGLTALLHYIYRFRFIILDVENAGFGRSLFADILSMIIMALPNLSSYVFSIVPAKKGKDGFQIWREYRDHAFIMFVKVWLFIAMYLYTKHTKQTSLAYESYYRLILEFGTMYGLQTVTEWYPNQVSTIRGMYKNPWTMFFAGFTQFAGRAALLYGAPDPRDDINLFVVGLSVIQLNAFNMTLRKKRIIGPKTTQTFYTVMLVLSFHLIFLRRLLEHPPSSFVDPRFKFVYLALVAYSCRRFGGFDRYSSWIVGLCIMGLVEHYFGLFQVLYKKGDNFKIGEQDRALLLDNVGKICM